MSIRVIKGNIISAPALGKLEILENGYLVAEDGLITGTFDKLPARYAGEPVEDYGDALVLQSFSDMHLHGPQFPMLGMGMDEELLGWLNTYTWPTEAKFADADYAREVYTRLARALIENGTTRVCMFSSLHKEGTRILMEALRRAGITGFVGKVNMDRNGGENLQETTQASCEATLQWLEACEDLEGIRPILTPRFSPSCTEELMAFLGDLAKERNLPVQSHLSESKKEIAWVRELFPDCDSYHKTYEKYGLWNDRTLMAHCVWSDEEELRAMKKAGVTVVHCPDSNSNLRSGIAPVRQMLDMGVPVVLGSDISGGDKLGCFDIVRSAIQVSKLRSALDETHPKELSAAEGWYLATSACNLWFGEKPGFGPGNALQAMVVEDSKLLSARKLTVAERFERLFYVRQERPIAALYSGDRKLMGKDV